MNLPCAFLKKMLLFIFLYSGVACTPQIIETSIPTQLPTEVVALDVVITTRTPKPTITPLVPTDPPTPTSTPSPTITPSATPSLTPSPTPIFIVSAQYEPGFVTKYHLMFCCSISNYIYPSEELLSCAEIEQVDYFEIFPKEWYLIYFSEPEKLTSETVNEIVLGKNMFHLNVTHYWAYYEEKENYSSPFRCGKECWMILVDELQTTCPDLQITPVAYPFTPTPTLSTD